jgi:hypothetical protein
MRGRSRGGRRGRASRGSGAGWRSGRRAFLAALAGAVFAAGTWLGVRWLLSHRGAPRGRSAQEAGGQAACRSLFGPRDLAG